MGKYYSGIGSAPSTFTIRFVKERHKIFGPESSKLRHLLGSIYWLNYPNHVSHKCCAIYGAIIVQRSVTVSSASARKGKGEGKGKGRIEKGEVNEGKERKERHPRRGKGDIKERIAKEKGREGEREREIEYERRREKDSSKRRT